VLVEISWRRVIGLFSLAFISNSVPYTTIPYLLIIAPELTKLRGVELALSILILALGASLGKLVVYSAGRLIGQFKRVRREFRGLVEVVNTHRNITFLTVFLAAALPIPDDIVYIPVGISGYNTVLFFTALFLGKLVVTIMATVFGFMVVLLIEEVEATNWMYVSSMIILTVVFTYVLGKINWSEIGRLYREEGLRLAAIYVVTSAIRALRGPINKILAHFKKLWNTKIRIGMKRNPGDREHR
jgi:membrane protein DedA with SNARE-associated domain